MKSFGDESITFATSNRLVFERAAELLLKWMDKQNDIMASSIKPNAENVNARYKYACNLKLIYYLCVLDTFGWLIGWLELLSSISMVLNWYSHCMKSVDIWSHSRHQLMSFGNGPAGTTLQRAKEIHCNFSDLRNKQHKHLSYWDTLSIFIY